MLCPKCEKEMKVVERKGVELDYCTSCGGFWFDYGEWNILCKRLISENFLDFPSDVYDIPVALNGEKSCKCPRCGLNMEKFILFDILLYRCPAKCGVLFDKNEFTHCINAIKDYSSSKRNEEIKFLGEMFDIE